MSMSHNEDALQAVLECFAARASVRARGARELAAAERRCAIALADANDASFSLRELEAELKAAGHRTGTDHSRLHQIILTARAAAVAGRLTAFPIGEGVKPRAASRPEPQANPTVTD